MDADISCPSKRPFSFFTAAVDEIGMSNLHDMLVGAVCLTTQNQHDKGDR